MTEAARLVEPLGVTWWIAGGWALDLHMGLETRGHEDLDIAILRLDQLRVQRMLSPEWELFKTKQPGLAPWPAGEALEEPVHDIWARRDAGSAWAFQLMLVDSDGGDWVYRRLPEIRLPLSSIVTVSREGIPYLKPAIQLLYKGGSSGRRSKDLEDLRRMRPFLSEAEVAWLRGVLGRQFPGGHEWLAELERSTSQSGRPPAAAR